MPDMRLCTERTETVDKIIKQLKYLKKSSVCGAFEMLFDDFRGYEGESEINEKNPQILNLIG